MNYSKTFFMVVSLLMLTLQQGKANSVENFDYADGALAGQSGGSGWTGSWTNIFSRNAGDVTVSSGAAFSPNDGTRFYRALDTNYSSGVVYIDLLMQVSGVDDNPFAALEVLKDATDTSAQNRFLSIGLQRSNETDVDQNDLALRDYYAIAEDGDAAGNVNIGQALLGDFNASLNRIIARMDLDTNTADVFFNPSSSTDLVNGTGDGGQIALAASTQFSAIGLANFGNQANPNSVLFDNIFVGTTAPTVVDAPSPALAGDVNDDDVVDINDFNLIRNNFRTSADFSNFMTGDISGPNGSRDFFVDFYDFIEWSDAFVSGGGSLAGLDLSLQTVPEPTSGVAVLSLLVLGGIVSRCPRRA